MNLSKCPPTYSSAFSKQHVYINLRNLPPPQLIPTPPIIWDPKVEKTHTYTHVQTFIFVYVRMWEKRKTSNCMKVCILMTFQNNFISEYVKFTLSVSPSHARIHISLSYTCKTIAFIQHYSLIHALIRSIKGMRERQCKMHVLTLSLSLTACLSLSLSHTYIHKEHIHTHVKTQITLSVPRHASRN